MIYGEFSSSDIWDTECDTIVIPVNTIGVMGAGMAKEVAERYKGLLYEYRRACKSGRLTVNNLWNFKTRNGMNILCFPTKEDWRNDSKIEWIENNLKLLSETWEELGIDSIAIPKIGCGRGGLKWNDVSTLIYKYLDPIDPPVYIYV